MAEAKIQTVPAGGITPPPDPWYVTMAKKTYGPTGATYTTAAGVEAKTFLGWTNTSILGIKSEQVIGGKVSTIMGGVLRTSLCADWNIQRGRKKDTSWGDKTEWRKGDITLRCFGKKVDFITQDETQFMLNDQAFNSLSKTEYLNLAGHTDYKKNIQQVAEDYKQNVAALRTDAQDIVNQAGSLESCGNIIKQTASRMDLQGLDVGIEAVAAVEISALKTKLTGSVALGGVNVPNPKIAKQLAKLNAALAVNTARRQELIVRGGEMKVGIAQQLASLP